jgi:predicted  nucleic acid-binding Zn-ribbon protein
MIGKTFKWMILGGAVLGGAGFLFLGTDFPSYLGTMAASVREGVAGQIPVEFELKRAEGLIRQIDPQIDTCKRDLARAEVELEELQQSIVRLEQVVQAEEKKLKTGARLLSDAGVSAGGPAIELAADHGARRRVSFDLQRTKDSYVNNVAILKAKRALIERQARAVDAAKQRLVAVRTEREALEDQVRSLKTQQQQVAALAASSPRFDLDSTALSQAKEVIAAVRKRLDIAQRMLENDMVFHGEEPLPVAVEERNVLQEIDELFADGGAAPGALGATVPQLERR